MHINGAGIVITIFLHREVGEMVGNLP